MWSARRWEKGLYAKGGVVALMFSFPCVVSKLGAGGRLAEEEEVVVDEEAEEVEFVFTFSQKYGEKSV